MIPSTQPSIAAASPVRRPLDPSRYRPSPDTLVGLACALALPIALLLA